MKKVFSNFTLKGRRFASWITAAFASLLLPAVAFAQQGTDADSILETFAGILNTIIPILVTIAVIWLIWNIIRYAIGKDEEEKGKARSGIIMGFIGLFLIVSIWGVIGILTNTFNIDQGGSITGQFIPAVDNAGN